jgi:hypothetical protein
MHLQVYCMFEIFGNENVRLFALSSSVVCIILLLCFKGTSY